MDPGHSEIAAISDPVLRNLWITQRYHELALALRECGARSDATWCAFAVWASKTAGSVIRNEDLPAAVRRVVAEHSAEQIGRFNERLAHGGRVEAVLGLEHLVKVTDEVCAGVAAQIAAGNALVFAELAAPFEAMVGCWPAGAEQAVHAAMRAVGDGPAREPLQRVFGLYGRALAAPPPRQAQLILAANILAVAHEQQRLQPNIAAALDTAVQDLLLRHLEAETLRFVPDVIRRAVNHLVTDVAVALDRACETVLTGAMLRLVTADERLDLGRDLPALAGQLWPAELTDVGEAQEVLGVWDRTGGSGRPTAARDWTVIGERMNYIVNLFRSRQRHPALFDPPFSPGQVARMRGGRVPDGPL